MLGCVVDLHCLHNWQELASGILAFVAGSLGFAAAIVAVVMTLTSERRKEDRSTVSLTRALTAEIMQLATHALEGFEMFRKSAASDSGTSLHELETVTRFPSAVVYPNNASQIGKLGDRTNDVVLFYSRLDILTGTIVIMLRAESERHTASSEAMASMSGRAFEGLNARANVRAVTIGKENTALVAEALLEISETAAKIVPAWGKGTIDQLPTEKFAATVSQKRLEWDKLKLSPRKRE